MMFDISTQVDLQALIDNEVTERKTLEFKEALPGNSHEDKREFLSDVTSFANASGGVIIYGMREEDGIATELVGFPNYSIDDAQLRLENMMRDGIDPRIIGLEVIPIQISDDFSVITLRIPRSFNSPHVVNYHRHWRFYSRNSAGKYPLDVDEVRIAFTASEILPERIRAFRVERLAKIIAGETPVLLQDGPKIVLHIFPLSAFDKPVKHDLERIMNDTEIVYKQLNPIYGGVSYRRHNLDGILTITMGNDSSPAESYLQVYRNGCIEAVEAHMLSGSSNREKAYIPSNLIEGELIKSIENYKHVLTEIGVEPPIYVMLSILRVKGFFLAVSSRFKRYLERTHKIDRDSLTIPEISLMSLDMNSEKIMQPIFDAIWNAAGWPRSLNYDEKGNWNPPPN